jgi:thymidylate synthase (FAD)
MVEKLNLPTVELTSHSPDPEKMMAYVARVSNPNNQSNPEFQKLIAYCLKNGHYSVFG